MSGSTGPATASHAAGPGEQWTILRLLLWSADYLAGKGVERGRLDAEHLLAHVLGVNRLEMYLQHERPLQPAELDAFRPLLKRRAAREPLQYIVGRQAFRELDLAVEPGVLIPRPETEELVEVVLAWARDRAPEELSAIDIGTGSGAIALALLSEGRFERVVATDASLAALDVAGRNAARLQLGDRLELREGRDYSPVRENERFDVVVSNPPYVAEGERSRLAPEVAEWEPAEALFAGADGLDALRRLVGGAAAVLRPGGLLALEVGDGQGPYVADLVRAAAGLTEATTLRDLAGKERFVTASRGLDDHS